MESDNQQNDNIRMTPSSPTSVSPDEQIIRLRGRRKIIRTSPRKHGNVKDEFQQIKQLLQSPVTKSTIGDQAQLKNGETKRANKNLSTLLRTPTKIRLRRDTSIRRIKRKKTHDGGP